MQRRAALATAAAITLTLATGLAAVGATTGLLEPGPGKGPGSTALLAESSTPTTKAPRIVTVYVDDPAPAASATAAAPRAAARAAAPGAAPTAPAPTSPGGTTPTAHGDDHPTTTTVAPPTTTSRPPTTTTQPGTWNCAGSDDGLTEAQKQAREAYCHALLGDD